jgi:hypothetical protein
MTYLVLMLPTSSLKMVWGLYSQTVGLFAHVLHFNFKKSMDFPAFKRYYGKLSPDKMSSNRNWYMQ